MAVHINVAKRGNIDRRSPLLQLDEISAGRGVQYMGAGSTLVDFKQVLASGKSLSTVLLPSMWVLVIRTQLHFIRCWTDMVGNKAVKRSVLCSIQPVSDAP